ncbi:MAG: hypothetical protein IPJ34_37330 [Myxococcales bacterium]|nr:hypothetical protein [Myxococcales bacterium]
MPKPPSALGAACTTLWALASDAYLFARRRPDVAPSSADGSLLRLGEVTTMSDPSQTSTSVSVTADEDAIPDEASIPVRLVLDARTFDQVVDALESPTAPTPRFAR